jgi:hypothetical protein
VFVIIHDAVLIADPYFDTLTDAAGKRGLHSELKIAVCLRYLGAGIGADQWDDKWEMSKTVIKKLAHRFCLAIVKAFGQEHLRLPTLAELNDISQRNALRGLPGCMGSIDCMHWFWTRCPMAQRGMYQGKGGKASVVLEAVADLDLRIWHADFGTPGSVNDITITWRSPLVTAFANGTFPPRGFNYMLQGRRGIRPYFLDDGIYPEWPLFLKTIPTPSTPKARLFAKKQESFRKEVECTFGILRARWHILQRPSLILSIRRMQTIIYTCIILHIVLLRYQQNRAAGVPNSTARRAIVLDEMVRFLPESLEDIRQSFVDSRVPPQFYREDVLNGSNVATQTAVQEQLQAEEIDSGLGPSSPERAVNAAYPEATRAGVRIAEAFMQSLYNADTGIFSTEGHLQLQRDAMDSIYELHGNSGESAEMDPYNNEVSSPDVHPRSSQESPVRGTGERSPTMAALAEDIRRSTFIPLHDSQASDSGDAEDEG